MSSFDSPFSQCNLIHSFLNLLSSILLCPALLFRNPQDLSKVANMIPENTSIKMLAFGLAMAHFVYGDNKACIIFIVQPGEKNVRLYISTYEIIFSDVGSTIYV